MKNKKFSFVMIAILFTSANISCNTTKSVKQPETQTNAIPVSGEIVLNSQKVSASPSPVEIKVPGVNFYKNISYGNSNANRFDIFLPDASQPSSLMIFIHGGGFTNGAKENAYQNLGETINKLLAKNIAFATLDYTLLTPDNTTGVMASVNDCKYALQFIRYYAGKMHIDKSKIALMGGSAGAGTSLWIGLHDEMADKKNTDPVLRESTRVSAIVASSTQATYAINRWADLVYKPYEKDGFTQDNIINIIGKERILNFYGFNKNADLNSPQYQQYAEQVNMLDLMSADDPEIYVENSREYKIPTTTGEVNHHPLHAKALMDAAEKNKMKGAFYIPAMKIDTRNGETKDEFIIRKIGK